MRPRLALALAVSVLLAAGALDPTAQAAAPSAAAAAAVPRPDHVVILVEENHSAAGVIGNPDAPFLTSLANDNANFVQSYAETHPSEPNYLAMYSGSTQGLTDDSCPHTYSTPNLGQSLLAAGLGFTGYSEGLPSVGYTGCFSGTYARKHNPWVNFPAVPASANQPFSAFPTDYSTLPEVSYVIPNLQNDMHDGTIAQGDAWARDNLGGYITWAKTHNSVFVLTFDEDDFSAGNRIPTVLAGQRVDPGTYTETIDHYDLLRTITDAFGLDPIGNAAGATPITDVWTAGGDPAPPTAAFASTCTGLSCAFDGSGSSDPDGSVVGYAWTFGDGATGTGRTPSHTYARADDYPVTLRVTDNSGTSSTPVTHTVTVHAASAAVTFVAAANAGGGNTTAKSVVVPGVAQVGDTAVLFLTATSGAVWSGPSGVVGWTRVDGFVGGSLATTVWVKRLGAGDAGSAVRFSSAAYTHASVDVAVYSGVDAAAPVAGFAHAADWGGVSHATPTVSAVAGDFAVSLWGDRSGSVRTWTPPAGLVARDASIDSGTSLTVQALVADAGAASGGGPAGGVTARTDAATSGTAMWTLVLHAASGTGPPPSAAVTFVAAANAGGGNTTAKSVVVPGVAQVGDTAVLFLTATSGAVWSGPSGVVGWTRVDGFVGGSLATTVWVKRLGAGDAGSAVRFSSAAYTHASVDVAVYSGVDAAAPVAGFAHAADWGGVSHATPTVSAVAGDFAVSLWGDRSGSVRTWTPPAGLVARDASIDSGTSLTVQALVADAGAASGGGPAGGVTARTDAATSGTAMWTLVLHAA